MTAQNYLLEITTLNGQLEVVNKLQADLQNMKYEIIDKYTKLKAEHEQEDKK